MNWISVKDRLPELDQEVLTYSEGGAIYVCYRYDYSKEYKWSKKQIESYGSNKYSWRQLGGCCMEDLGEDPTHWMPLPESPYEC